MNLKMTMNKIIVLVIKNIGRLYKIDKNLIIMIFKGFSGSNLTPLIDRIENGKLGEYRVEVVRLDNSSESNSLGKLKSTWKRYKLLNKAKLVITTHGPMKIKNKTINLDLWHGFPIKGMNLMDKNISKKRNFDRIDYAISLSSTYSSLLNSCIGIEGEKYKITGYPRNDFLIKSEGEKKLSNIFNIDLSKKKVILFIPTYRKTISLRNEDGEKNYNNIFGFDNFDIDEFCKFLKTNDFMFIIKLHPNEEYLYKFTFDFHHENIRLLLESKLSENKTDLYEIVNATDMLITDFSSIYFDYLLLDRPIIFTPVDIEKYTNTRGFLVNPTYFWFPGDICLNYDDLIEKITENIFNDANKEKRMVIKNIVHKYSDSESTTRVIELIKNIMKNK